MTVSGVAVSLNNFLMLGCLIVLSLDTGSFIVNLKSRRDRGFHVFKELCQFLPKLGRVRANSFPAENDYHGIMSLSFSDAEALSVEDFITRSKLGTRLNTCCRRKAEKEMGEERNKTLSLDEVTANNREEFGRSTRGYVARLLKTTQSLTRFTSDIVRGLGSFDLKIMLIDPLEQATYCFK